MAETLELEDQSALMVAPLSVSPPPGRRLRSRQTTVGLTGRREQLRKSESADTMNEENPSSPKAADPLQAASPAARKRARPSKRSQGPEMEEEERPSSPELVEAGSTVATSALWNEGPPRKSTDSTESEAENSSVPDSNNAASDVLASAATSGGEIVLHSDGATATDGVPKSAEAKVKNTLRLFNKYFLQQVQAEEKRVQDLAAKLSKVSPTKLKGFADVKKLKRSKNGVKNMETDAQAQKKNRGRPKQLKNGNPDDQSDDSNDDIGGTDMKRGSKRPDLKAITIMKDNNEILYPEKRIGSIPGIEVGYQFYSRAEMVVVGFHSHWLNGIDFMGANYAKMKEYREVYNKFPLAVCIVLSGMYEDDLDNADTITYTGQGGHDLLCSKKQISDQKLVRGNLALKNSCDQCVPVRVVRGHESANSYSGKVYTYDGLYEVLQCWDEKGVSGFKVYKYRLRRLAGQPALTTTQVYFTRAQPPREISELRGLVCEDISGGKENFPIPATNEVDDPPFAPQDFEYITQVVLPASIQPPLAAAGCNCEGDCGNPNFCACARLNGGDFPYVRKDGGRLIEAKAVVFECGPNCGCGPSCVNRTSQKGLKYRFEVYRTSSKGWAVRSWDFIPSGAPICEYIGVLSRTDEIDSTGDNNYIFDIDCLQTMKGMEGREKRIGEVALEALQLDNTEVKDTPEFCIDAAHLGNIARFINHSCQPNVFVQCVVSSHQDLKLARITLFAADNIPAMQELTYDYGYALDSVVGPDGAVKKLFCLCGAPECRKRLY